MIQPDLTSEGSEFQIDLRSGPPYAKLIKSHGQFASFVGDYFSIDPDHVIATSGATGAIELIRNHVFRLTLKSQPVLLTVSPGYWRAREIFQGFGFKLVDIETAPACFDISEATLVQKASEIRPDIVYLSLPNNPTGAIFDPSAIITGISETTAVIFDLTLPSRQLNTRTLIEHLQRSFHGRRRLFFVGSTSKSHHTAEYRIGWAICSNCDDAGRLRKENRNVVSSVSVEQAFRKLKNEAPVNALIEKSFQLLKKGEVEAEFRLVRPARSVETSYVLIRFAGDSRERRSLLERRGVAVMWGSEFGLTDEYARLEVSEPENVQAFIRFQVSEMSSRRKTVPSN